MLYVPSDRNATAVLRVERISRADAEDRTAFAVAWMAGEVSLFPSIALAERIFQAPKSRIRSSANACGYTSIRKRKQSKTPKTLAEIWRSACEAERAEFLRACGAELWVA